MEMKKEELIWLTRDMTMLAASANQQIQNYIYVSIILDTNIFVYTI